MTLKLSEMKEGEKGRVLEISGSEQLKKKILVMGILPGEEVIVDRIAPFGSPIVVNVKNMKVALRKDEANHITVEK